MSGISKANKNVKVRKGLGFAWHFGFAISRSSFIYSLPFTIHFLSMLIAHWARSESLRAILETVNLSLIFEPA